MKIIQKNDVICMGITDGTDDAEADLDMGDIARRAWQQVRQQHVPYSRVVIRPVGDIEWLVTDDPAEADAFVPIHDCAVCKQSGPSAAKFLTENPGSKVAMGNIRYDEAWLTADELGVPHYEEPTKRAAIAEILNADTRYTLASAEEMLSLIELGKILTVQREEPDGTPETSIAPGWPKAAPTPPTPPPSPTCSPTWDDA